MSNKRIVDFTVGRRQIIDLAAYVRPLEVESTHNPEIQKQAAKLLVGGIGGIHSSVISVLADPAMIGCFFRLPDFTDWERVWFLIALSHMLGEPHHNANGSVHQQLTTTSSDEHLANDRNSVAAGSKAVEVHSDGLPRFETRLSYDYVLLYCYRLHGCSGGNSTFMHMHDLPNYQNWANDPIGRTDFRFLSYARGTEPWPGMTVIEASGPLFWENDGDYHWYLLTRFLRGVSIEQEDFLARLDKAVLSSGKIVEKPLPPGAIWVVNNRKVLHGRTAFEVGPEYLRRFLRIRVWRSQLA